MRGSLVCDNSLSLLILDHKELSDVLHVLDEVFNAVKVTLTWAWLMKGDIRTPYGETVGHASRQLVMHVHHF